jgi:predicted nucleic acid-binding protein
VCASGILYLKTKMQKSSVDASTFFLLLLFSLLVVSATPGQAMRQRRKRKNNLCRRSSQVTQPSPHLAIDAEHGMIIPHSSAENKQKSKTKQRQREEKEGTVINTGKGEKGGVEWRRARRGLEVVGCPFSLRRGSSHVQEKRA